MHRVLTRTRGVLLVLVTLLVLGACAPHTQAIPAPGAASGPAVQPVSERPTLRMATQREPSMFSNLLTTATETSGGLRVLKQIPHNQLVVLNDRGAWVPQLAAEQLAVERGTWRVNPDGTMDTVWKLRPNTKWQDGAPFTSDDLLFSFTVYKDREISNRGGASLALMTSASAPDPLTFVVHWSAPYVFADQAPGLEPLARHRMEELYLTDKTQFTNSSLFREDFVGLGAYQLVSWQQGSHFEFVAFDDYYLGRPPLARVIVRVIPDLNTMVANIMAGSLDVITDVGVSLETALEVRDRWQGTGNQVLVVPGEKPGWIDIQHRPDIARPLNGPTNRAVRQAFLHGLNREAFAELFTAGLSPVPDSWVDPTSELYSQLAPAIPRYPYDPARAQQLLADAGWVRGADGLLVHQTTRDVFQMEARFADDGESEKLLTIAADNWRALGMQISLVELTPALKSNNEFFAKFSGVHGRTSPSIPFNSNYLHPSFVAGPDNRWTGSILGYSNPKVGELLDRYVVTIDPEARLAVHRELLNEVFTDVPMMPTHWRNDPILAVNGVTGIKGREAWNFQEWAKQ
jgi:peptide/nickel transport system substrate-binding protein